MNLDIPELLSNIYNKLYKKDVDYSLNIFLCGSETGEKDSIRNLIYEEVKDNPRYNVVFPEFLFSHLLHKRKFNLLKLEDELASYVDIIILPLESLGVMCELGAFAVKEKLRPKIIVINNNMFMKKRSFITIGPIELIEKENKRNLIYYDDRKKDEIIKKVIERLKGWRTRNHTSQLTNIFNLSRLMLFVIALFQPVTKKNLNLILKNFKAENINLHYIESAIQILIQRNRIEQDIDEKTLEEIYCLSKNGHYYVFEQLLSELDIKIEFSEIRTNIINSMLKPKKLNLNKELKFLEF